MLNSSERAELEQYRRADRINQIISLVIAGFTALFIGGCTVAAYKADAFTGAGLDVVKMVRYYRDKDK